MPSTLKTIKVRVRDKHAKVLRAMAYESNQVWNYCAELRDLRAAQEAFLSKSHVGKIGIRVAE